MYLIEEDKRFIEESINRIFPVNSKANSYKNKIEQLKRELGIKLKAGG